MRPRSTTVLIAVLVALLLLSLLAQIWLLPSEVWRWVGEYPVLEPLAAPGILWEIAAIACWQGVGLIGLRVVVLVHDRRFDASAYGWLWAMMGLLIAFVVLVVAAFVVLKSSGFWSPGVGGGFYVGGFFGLVGIAFLAIFLVTVRQGSGNSSKAVQADE